MPWCPKCRTEYQEGCLTCSDCGEELAAELEPVAEEKLEYDTEAFLMSVSGDMEANIIESLLNPEGIPVRRKYSEAGAYMSVYMGMSNAGVDLFVPGKLLEKAKGIVNANIEATPQAEEEVKAERDEAESMQTTRRTMAWIMVAILLVPTVIAFIFALCNYGTKIYKMLGGLFE